MASIGMRYFIAAPITSETGGTITYGTTVTLKAVEANLAWELDDSKLYADDAVAESEGSISGYTLDATVDNLTDAQEASLVGREKVGSTDEYEATDSPAPYSGAGYVRVLKKNGVRKFQAFFYPRLQFTLQNENARTREQSTTWGTPQLHGIGMAQYDESSGKNKFRRQQTFDTMAAAISYLQGKFA